MSKTVGDFFWERMHEWGVRIVFGYPGDGINGLLGAMNRADGKIKLVQVRHEEMAAFMASAYAKFTGDLGVCMATSGPGASHLITGLYDARMDHMPVLAITGQQARAAIGGHYQQEIDVKSMFKDVAGAFVEEASVPSQVRHLIDRAIRVAKGERRVTAIILPNDLQDVEYEPPAAQARHGAFRHRLQRACDRAEGRRPAPRRRGAERGQEGRDPGRRRRAARDGRGDRGRREARRRRRQGAARQGGAARRAPLRHRLHRPARHEAELGHDDGLRHAADDRLGLPLFGIPAQGRPGARRADRPQARHAEPALPDGGEPRGRQRGHAEEADAADRAEDRTAPGARRSRRA